MMPAVTLLLLVACAGGASDESASSDDSGGTVSSPCRGDLPPESVEVVAAGLVEGTEGLAFLDGALYVSTPTGVLRVAPEGTVEGVWENDHALGLAAVGSALWVADPGEFSFGGDTDGELWSLNPTGQATLLSSGWSNPNFLAATPWGTVLLSDDTQESVWELQADGTGAVWLDGVPSPNGIVVTEEAVTVASTFVEDGAVYRAPVTDGVAGAPALLATTVAGGANDGLALGEDGSVWVAVNLAGELWRIDPDGVASRFVHDLDSPASLAFGQGQDWDPCSLYVTSLFGEEVVRVVVE